MTHPITIVGPQADDTQAGGDEGARADKGIQAVLMMAASDEGFRARFLGDRDSVLAEVSASLSTEEADLLREMPPEQLDQMIRDQRVDHETKSRIKSLIVAAGIAVAIATLIILLAEMKNDVHELFEEMFLRIGGIMPQIESVQEKP